MAEKPPESGIWAVEEAQTKGSLLGERAKFEFSAVKHTGPLPIIG
jgi:hypothetical protein